MVFTTPSTWNKEQKIKYDDQQWEQEVSAGN